MQAANVGIYTVRASTGFQTNESQDASLQINSLGSQVQNVQGFDKVEDAQSAPAFHLALVPGSLGQGGPAVRDRPDIVSVVQGITGQQILTTTTSGSGFGEIVCGLICGKSSCVNLVADVPGLLMLNTDGTSFDTVMEVRRYQPGGSFVTLACDDNSGANSVGTGKTSALSLLVPTGPTNVIFVGGVAGASGTVKLNCALLPVALNSLGLTNGAEHLQVLRPTNGPAIIHITLQASSNLLNWTPLSTNDLRTNGLDYIDAASTNLPRRFYRAVLLP